MAAEKAGVPSVTVICSGFIEQGQLVAEKLGYPALALAEYSGHVDADSETARQGKVADAIPAIVKALTGTAKEARAAAAVPGPRQIVFSGTFEEVNELFHEKLWSDGLPIVPPTIEKVEQFLRYTDYPPDESLGVFSPANCPATPWKVAVNGVMAGCRPEYMPVLIAIVKAMAVPGFGAEHSGSSPGIEIVAVLNGPIIDQLRFNYKEAVLRTGYQANSSIGRFIRLFMRNLPRFLPGLTDKATFGRPFMPVLPENERVCADIGWRTLAVERGFAPGDNVVTLNSVVGYPYCPMLTFKDSVKTDFLDWMAYNMSKTIRGPSFLTRGSPQFPLIVLTPAAARDIAGAGYSKADVRQYLFDHAKVPAKSFDYAAVYNFQLTACQAVKEGLLPGDFCESTDPERMLPIVQKPDHFLIVVSGDPGRNRMQVLEQNHKQGPATSMRIELPTGWDKMMAELHYPGPGAGPR